MASQVSFQIFQLFTWLDKDEILLSAILDHILFIMINNRTIKCLAFKIVEFNYKIDSDLQ